MNVLENQLMNLEDTNIQILGLNLLLNFIACLVMSLVLRSFYLKFSFSLSGKQNIGTILPILSLTVFMVIVIVKSSLALSLGLVGALSIVRFRTPIKEPEELVYLFLAIAIGLGFGAGRLMTTILISTFILVVIYFWLSNKAKTSINEYNLIVTWKNNNLLVEDVVNELKKYAENIDLVRTDFKKDESQAVFVIYPKNLDFFAKLKLNLEKKDGDIIINFFKTEINF